MYYCAHYIWGYWSIYSPDFLSIVLGGFWGMLPRENFLKWCNLVGFGEYFAKIL